MRQHSGEYECFQSLIVVLHGVSECVGSFQTGEEFHEADGEAGQKGPVPA